MPIKPTELSLIIEGALDRRMVTGSDGREYVDAEWILRQLCALTDPPYVVHVDGEGITWQPAVGAGTMEQAIAVLEDDERRKAMALCKAERAVYVLEKAIGEAA